MKTLSQMAKAMGKAGGNKTKTTHAPDYYEKIGRLGALNRWKDHVKGTTQLKPE